ncbi:SDR family NAD(P)-dependent oxidoreductase [Kitasatospora sp. NPDC059571]|uniref:SDR family NAD(P)-dependent oxidoreductase n=1 Tax=Kitasatospora sp. NPDC059571 TaxID=3346871 RepID=UPI0036868D53
MHAPPGLVAYAASKFALKAVAESLRAEEYGNGVRVTTVYPGEVDTPMQVRLHERLGLPHDPAAAIAPESVAAVVASGRRSVPGGALWVRRSLDGCGG